MNILYCVFGDNLGYHLQAYLSIRTFQKQLAADDRIYVLTTRPEYYRRAKVEILDISDEQIEAWQGKHHFFFRVKIMAMEYLRQCSSDSHLLYLDSDTFLYGSLSELKDRLERGHGLMHCCEGHPKNMKGGSLTLWKTVAGHTYGDITLDSHHDMWNAGVVGIPAGKAKDTIATALRLCDGMLDEGANCFILEQYANSVSMAEHTMLTKASDHIGHYWGNKVEWEKVAADLLLRSFMSELSLEEELQTITDELLRSTPVFVHHSSTAEKLHKFVGRHFADSNHEYI